MDLLNIIQRLDQSLIEIDKIRQEILKSKFAGKSMANTHLFNALTNLSLCSYLIEDLEQCITENDKQIVLESLDNIGGCNG